MSDFIFCEDCGKNYLSYFSYSNHLDQCKKKRVGSEKRMKFDCYEAAGKLISRMKKHAKLCNGHVYSRKLKEWIKHAWVEQDEVVYDFSNDQRWKTRKDIYYKEGKVKDVIYYSREQAIKMLQGTGKFDFWTEEQRKKILKE